MGETLFREREKIALLRSRSVEERHENLELFTSTLSDHGSQSRSE